MREIAGVDLVAGGDAGECHGGVVREDVGRHPGAGGGSVGGEGLRVPTITEMPELCKAVRTALSGWKTLILVIPICRRRDMATGGGGRLLPMRP